jgi:hypothetical protein
MNRRALLTGLAALIPSAAFASILPTADPFEQARRVTYYKSEYPVARAECWHITSQKTAVIYFPDGTIETYPESYLDQAIRRTLDFNKWKGASYHEFTDGRAPTLAEALEG